MQKYSKTLESGYHKLDLDISDLASRIKVSIEGKEFFITLFLFQNDRQICQITANKAGSRIITDDPLTTSPSCKNLDGKDGLSLEYSLYTSDKDNEINLIIEKVSHDDLISYEDEINIYKESCLKDEQGWYSGDFHTHTIYSDGKLSREENLVVASSRDLDFFAPTEHNVFHRSWPKSDILIIPGMEFTGGLGHFNILFAEVDSLKEGELKDLNDKEKFGKVLDTYKDQGVISLNHPFLNPWELRLSDYKLEKISTMEIINDPTFEDNIKANEKALKAWSLMLNDGYKVVGIGGSDSHNYPQESYTNSKYPSLIGDPKTWIYARSLSKKALKEGLLAGKVCVSREDVIELKDNNGIFTADIGRDSYHKSRLKIQWIVNAEIVKESMGPRDDFAFDPKDDYAWLRVNVRTEDNLLYGFSNPIFFNEDKKASHKLITWKDLEEKIND